MDVTALMAALENLVLERVGGGTFVRRGDLPPWGRSLSSRELPTSTPFVLEEVFPFLGAFLEEAAAAWGHASAPVHSDLWTEVGPSGQEIHLQASALRVLGADVLVITESDRLFEQHQLVLQRARELRLTHTALMREIEQKDILVHTIVHDLAAPLHGILGALSLLSERPLDEPSAQWVRVSLQASIRQRQLIGDILDVFSSEHSALSGDIGDGAPDACQAASGVVAELTPAGERQGVGFESRLEDGPCLVVGEETRLVRVLSNLADNALRHSPRGSTIRVTVRRQGHAIYVSVEDRGPGVPTELLPRLFEKFARGRAGGETGLGLYFCRITVENWGGEIGYEPREEGGARFWLRLPVAESENDHG